MIARVNSAEASSRRSQQRKRAGVAAVEFAICLPILAALVFGSIEASKAVFVQQALTASAYEAGNVASAMDGTADDAVSRANQVLTSLGVKSTTVSISPAVTADTPIGTVIVITCSAPLGANTATNWCLGNRTLTAKFTIPRL
jgi:Flp pilus assembly protein TadG